MRELIYALGGTLAALGLASVIINVLALTGPFFMLQVYDRVLPSGSVPTLVGLMVIAVSLYFFQGVLEIIRTMILARIGLGVDDNVGPHVFRALSLLSARTSIPGDGLQPVRDLEQIRSFLGGLGPTALFDLPWIPFYIGLCFVFHPTIGFTALCGAALLLAVTLAAEVFSRKHTQTAARHGAARLNFAESVRRNWEAVEAMGLGKHLLTKWKSTSQAYLQSHTAASDVTGSLSVLSKGLRMLLQSGVLAVGALLVIRQEASAGIMIASSILVSRGLAPVELAVAHWRGFVMARSSYSRLAKLMEVLPQEGELVRLPKPSKRLTVENLTLVPPGSSGAVLRNVALEIEAGSAIGVIGPSASGKSTLARALVGLWQPATGCIRLDGAALDQWDRYELARNVGYLPQDVELFEGTIAENISRFEEGDASEKVIAAARSAGIFEMVIGFPGGFGRQVGNRGAVLSAGQRQRIGLARALYGNPFLVVLDEPNSNLDADGDAALSQAISAVRARKGIAVVIAHRPSALAAVDQVALLAGGRIQAIGQKDEILGRVLRQDVGSAGLRLMKLEDRL
ncbi:type I secretion system permease/ATPase [Rhizobium sp. TRM95001]|nr:type I secretion system permease/ATPase [Rhizobium halophilum]